jgi:hypothetical protein
MPELAPDDMPLEAPELMPDESPDELMPDELPPPELLIPLELPLVDIPEEDMPPLLDGVSLGVLDGVCVVPGVLLVNASVV